MRAAQHEKAHGTAESLDKLLRNAVSYCPSAQVTLTLTPTPTPTLTLTLTLTPTPTLTLTLQEWHTRLPHSSAQSEEEEHDGPGGREGEAALPDSALRRRHPWGDGGPDA